MSRLHEACAAGNLPAAIAFLDAGDQINEPHPIHGATPLCYAVQSGELELVQELLKRGAKVQGSNPTAELNNILYWVVSSLDASKRINILTWLKDNYDQYAEACGCTRYHLILLRAFELAVEADAKSLTLGEYSEEESEMKKITDEISSGDDLAHFLIATRVLTVADALEPDDELQSDQYRYALSFIKKIKIKTCVVLDIEGRAHSLLAEQLRLKGDVDGEGNELRESVRCIEQLGPYKSKDDSLKSPAMVYKSLGVHLVKRKEYKAGITNFEKGIALLNNAGELTDADRRLLMLLCESAGNTFANIGKQEGAIAYYHAALNALSKLQQSDLEDLNKKIEVHLYLAVASNSMKSYRDAIDYCARGIELHKELGEKTNDRLMFSLLVVQSNAFAALGQHDSAILCKGTAFSHFDNIDKPRERDWLSYNQLVEYLAQHHIAKKSVDGVIKLFKLLLESRMASSRSDDNSLTVAVLHAFLASCYKSKGMFAEHIKHCSYALLMICAIETKEIFMLQWSFFIQRICREYGEYPAEQWKTLLVSDDLSVRVAMFAIACINKKCKSPQSHLAHLKKALKGKEMSDAGNLFRNVLLMVTLCVKYGIADQYLNADLAKFLKNEECEEAVKRLIKIYAEAKSYHDLVNYCDAFFRAPRREDGMPSLIIEEVKDEADLRYIL